MDIADLKEADIWIWKWRLYTRRRDMRGQIDSVAPYCKQAVSSRQWQDTGEIADNYEHSATLRKIDSEIMQKLPPVHAAAIMAEMRNREAARVWRVDGDYVAALKAVDEVMRDKGIL